MSGLRIFSSPLCADHVTPPGHPDRAERWEAMQRAAFGCIGVCGPVVEGRLATEAELTGVHDATHVARIRETAGRAVSLDPDTFTSPRSYDAACAAAGAALSAVQSVLEDTSTPRAVALVRPPGHHAERARPMGFCLFNNVAVAAAYARRAGLARVAIVDIDVHHGNGTQDCFYDDPSVLFISMHQSPYYPGTGADTEIGSGPGRGFTVNVPLAAGATDGDYDAVFDRVVEPVLRQFGPELVLVSAGFDAHADDPLGGMRLTTGAFGRLTVRLRTAADESAAGRLVLVTEGGYDLDALEGCVRTVIHALGDTSASGASMPAGPSPRADAALERVLPRLRPYWRL
jgi:acetoin utilization deacetylase AcuC-like enzyme